MFLHFGQKFNRFDKRSIDKSHNDDLNVLYCRIPITISQIRLFFMCFHFNIHFSSSFFIHL